jgi:hypothetical protein
MSREEGERELWEGGAGRKREVRQDLGDVLLVHRVLLIQLFCVVVHVADTVTALAVYEVDV